jgi:D-alanyl-D-alanine carboxypeptidase
VLTAHHGLGDWGIALLDTIYRLPAEHAPGDLVDTSAAGLNAGFAVRGLLVTDLAAMAAAAREAGAPLAVVSGYRSHATQQGTFQHWVDVGGYDQALRTSARPGHSEHQLGTALDLTSEGGAAPWDYADWGATPAGAWVARNAWRYGFVVSYPPGSFARTCYSYEPWHVRYVGRDRAAAMVSSGMTPREFLWRLQ